MLRFFSASFCSARFRLPGCFLVFFVSLVIFMFAPFLRCCLWFAVFVHFALNCSCLPLYQLLQRASEIASKFQVFFFLTVVFFQFFTSTWTILSNTLTMWFNAFAHKFHWHRNFILMTCTIALSLSLFLSCVSILCVISQLHPPNLCRTFCSFIIFHSSRIHAHIASHSQDVLLHLSLSRTLLFLLPSHYISQLSHLPPSRLNPFVIFCLLSLLCPWFLSMFLIFFRTF